MAERSTAQRWPQLMAERSTAQRWTQLMAIDRDWPQLMVIDRDWPQLMVIRHSCGWAAQIGPRLHEGGFN